MTLSSHAVRPDPGAVCERNLLLFRQIVKNVLIPEFCREPFFFNKFRTAGGKALIAVRNRENFKFRALFHKKGNHLLIFFRGERTGRIEKHATGTEHIGSPENDFFLHPGTFQRFFRFPGFGCVRIFPEHAFSGTGCIHQDLIKKFREVFR